MATVAGVGENAQQVQSVYAGNVSIQNTGLSTVYFGSDSSVSPVNGWQVPPLGYVTWLGGTSLWVCTDKGAKSSLLISDAALAAFTPGPDRVSIDGGVVIEGGVAVSGDIDVSGSNVYVSGTVTATPNASVSLVSDSNERVLTGAATSSNPLTLYSSPAGSVLTGMQSLVITLNDSPFDGSPSPSLFGATVIVRQLDPAGNIIREERPQFASGETLRYTTAIVGARVVVAVFANSSTMTSWTMFGLKITATAALIPHEYSVVQSLTAASSATLGFVDYSYRSRETVWTGTVPADADGATWYPPTFAGETYLYMQGANSVSGAFTVTVTNAINGRVLYSTVLNNAATAGREHRMLLPEIPVMIELDTNAVSAQPFTVALIFQ